MSTEKFNRADAKMFTPEYAEALMRKIDLYKIGERMNDHVLAEADLEPQKLMTDGQVRVALAMWNKVVPEAPKRIEHSAGGSLADLIAASFELEKQDEGI